MINLQYWKKDFTLIQKGGVFVGEQSMQSSRYMLKEKEKTYLDSINMLDLGMAS